MVTKHEKPITTMQEIATLAGVSRTAVSAVLNNVRGTIRLNEETRRKIESVLRKTNYRANTVGKALALGRSLVIGVIVTEIDRSFTPQALQAIEDFTEKSGYGVLLMTTRNDPARSDQVMEFMLERRVEGIIFGDWSGLSEKIRNTLIEKNIPLTYLFQHPENQLPRSGYVCVDPHQVGYLAVRHLLDLGHRHIVCAGVGDRVQEGIRQAASEVTTSKKIETWPWQTSTPDGREPFEHWLRTKPRPTAMFIQSDEFACQIINLAIRQGIQIPRDLALVGVDDIPAAAQAAIPLTTISQPKYEQGLAAIQTLFDLIEGKPPQNLILKPTLVKRQTT
jgi:LacI family transcriptional regulator